MKNLKIRAYIRTEIITDRYLPLDGLLYYQAVRRELGPPDISLSNKPTLPGGFSVDLPFAKTEGEDWFYKCSFAQWSPNAVEHSGFYTKRFDLQHASHLTNEKKVETKRGHFKNLHNKVYTLATDWVEWYAVGDKQAIEDLLRFCTHIGKKTSQGYGRVHKWEIENCEGDFSVYKNEELMRAIPNKDALAIYGIRPSYWARENQIPCELP